MFICIFFCIAILFVFFILKHNLSMRKSLCKIIEENLNDSNRKQNNIDKVVILPFKFSTKFLLSYIKKVAKDFENDDKYYKHIFMRNLNNILIAVSKINTKKVYYIPHSAGVPVIFYNFVNHIENSDYNVEELKCINDMFAYYNLLCLYTILQSKAISQTLLNCKVEQCINSISKYASEQKIIYNKKLKSVKKVKFNYLFALTNQKATLLISKNFNGYFDYKGYNFLTFNGEHFCGNILNKNSLDININGEHILENSTFLGGRNTCTFLKKCTDFITFISVCSPPNFDGLLCKIFAECKSNNTTNFVVTSEWNLPNNLKDYSITRKKNKHALIIKNGQQFIEYKIVTSCVQYSADFDNELGIKQTINANVNAEIFFTLKVQNNNSFTNLLMQELEYCFTDSRGYYYELLLQNQNKFTGITKNDFAYKLLNNYTDFSTHSLIKTGKLNLQILNNCDIDYRLPIVKVMVQDKDDLVIFNQNLNDLLLFNSVGIYYNLVVLYNAEKLKKYLRILTLLKTQKYVIKPKIICISFAEQKYVGLINLLDINNATMVCNNNKNLFSGLKITGNVEYTINEYLDILKNVKYYSAYIKNSHNAITTCEVSFYENIEQEQTKFYKEKKNSSFLFYNFIENVLYRITCSDKFVDCSKKTCPEIALKTVLHLPLQSKANIVFKAEKFMGFNAFKSSKHNYLSVKTDSTEKLILPVNINCNNKNLSLLINSLLFENAQKICAKSFFTNEYLKNYFNQLKFFTFNKCRELEEIFISFIQNHDLQSECLNEFLETLLTYCVNSGDIEFNRMVKDFCCKNVNANNLYLTKLCGVAFYGTMSSTSIYHNLNAKFKSTSLENCIKKIYGLAIDFSLSVSECFEIYEYFLESIFGIKILHGKAYLTKPELNIDAQLKLEFNENKILINYIKKPFNADCRLVSGGVEYSINNLPVTAFKDIDFII